MNHLLKTVIIGIMSLFLLSPSLSYADNTNVGVFQDDILEVIKNGDYMDIKKLNNGNGGEITPSDVDIKKNTRGNIELPNGTYLLNRGTGWVLGNDASFIKSGYASPNGKLVITEGNTVNRARHEVYGYGAELDLNYVKVAVEKTFEHTISESKTTSVHFEIVSPNNKNTFMKTYATFNRYDVIKVENKQIIGQSATYEPEGAWAKYIHYTEGEYVDQDALEESYNRSVLGEASEVKIKNSIQVSGVINSQQESHKISLNSSNSSILFLNRSNSAIHAGYGNNLYFKFRLLDKNKNEKFSITMNGNDRASDSKYDKLNYLPYENGDYIELHHEEPFRMSISGNIPGGMAGKKTQIYKIEEYGLTYDEPNIKIKDSYYKMLSVLDSNRVIHNNPYTSVVLYFDEDVDANIWEFKYDESKDAYKIKNKKYGSFLKYYEPKNNIISTSGNDDKMYDYWRLKEGKNGTYIIENVGSGKVINVPNSNITPSTELTGSYRTGENNQQFKLQEAVYSDSLTDGMWKIESKLQSNKLITYKDGNVSSWDNNRSSEQKWKLEYDSSKNAYIIRNVGLGIDNNQVLAWNDYLWSDNVFTTTFQAKPEHYWVLEKVDDEYYILKNYKDQSMVLDITGSSTDNGANIIVDPRHNGNNQKFRFIRL